MGMQNERWKEGHQVRDRAGVAPTTRLRTLQQFRRPPPRPYSRHIADQVTSSTRQHL
jgi:hypothetical protein